MFQQKSILYETDLYEDDDSVIARISQPNSQSSQPSIVHPPT